jgi:hypothetical protein
MAYIGKNPRWNTGGFVPQAADPANPVEGMLFWSNGTPRAAGLWQYKSATWEQILPAVGIDNKFERIQGLIVGTASDVTNGIADFSSIQSAITASAAGGKITILGESFTENITVTKKLHIVGNGHSTVINGTVNLDAAASDSSIKFLKFNDNVTADASCNKLIITDCFLASTKTITVDNILENIVLVIQD